MTDSTYRALPQDPLTQPHSTRIGKAMCLLIALLSASLNWISAGDHPLYPPDEGRYASVSLNMAESDEWLVPMWFGHPHLTKPPLTYWMQAAAIRVLGRDEWAMRLPGLIAGSGTVLLTYWFGCKLRNERTALVAAGMLAIMPLHVVVTRLAITDPILTFFWTVAIFCGWAAIESGRKRCAAAMWVAVALGLLTKGPLALCGPGILLAWLALSGRFLSHVGRLRIMLGLPLALLPLVLWGHFVLRQVPHAMEIWLHETVSRAEGTGDHPEPVWFYIPVLLGGAFPATTMLALPGWNISWSETWRRMRGGGPVPLLVLAVALPFVMFSLIAGKLMTYLLPVCPAMALLTAVMLDGWLTGEHDTPAPGSRPPDVIYTLTITSFLIVVGVVGADAVLGWGHLEAVVPLVVLPLSALGMCYLWRKGRSFRAAALALYFLGASTTWFWVYEIEDVVIVPMSGKALVESLNAEFGTDEFALATYGFTETTLSFYHDSEVRRLETPEALAEFCRAAELEGKPVRILFDKHIWDVVISKWPRISDQYRALETRKRWPNDASIVMEPIAPDATQ